MSDAGTAFVTLTIAPDSGLDFAIDLLEANEELGRPFTITLDVSSDAPKGDLHGILGSSATVKLSYPNKPVRYFNGIIARAQYRGLSAGGYRYRLELRPWIWLLSQQQDCCIFSNKSPWTIMTDLFRAAGFTGFADKRQNASGDIVLDYCVQYRETTLDFVTRLMEQYGLYYYVSHADGAHTINFADDPNSHTALSDPLPYMYNQSGWAATQDHLWDWSADAGIQPGASTFRDYNFTTPKADLTAKSLIPGGYTHGTSEVYDYPGLYDTANAGQKAAQIRMQGYATQGQSFGGTSNCRALGTGSKFTLSEFADAAANQEYLVIGSICTVERAETAAIHGEDDPILDSFRCVVRAIPGSRPFRLPPITPRPLIRGPQTARVAGESGQEITTDSYGRIKVKFPWDRRTTEDENSSCWIRVAQLWAGQAWGAMFIPRIGQEVVVEFLEGNPDRPIVTGQVYNAEMTVPYALPENRTRSTIKSNSSMNGAGFNELRFEDKKGSEEVFFHAQKDFNETILNNHTATITKDTTTTVSEGNRSVTVSQGNDTLTVSQGNDSLTVSTGDHTITVSAGKSTISAGTSITLKVGSNSIEITTSGITISGATVKVSAQTSMEIAGLNTKVSGSADLALSGGAHAALKAALVEIN